MEKKVHLKRKSRRKKVCVFCVDKCNVLDYKDTGRFKRFLTDRGKIYPRRNSGICAKHQRMLATAIKRARIICLIPHCVD
ncbi:MAG: 30S ribosomal protein S18 [bacterium]|nr:30S ribosomal protein S18 [bacterium]